jgi:hypothetical protein
VSISILGIRKSHTVQDLVSTERVRAFVFLLWLKTGGFEVTILEHTCFAFEFVVKICLPVPLSTFKSSAIILMPERRSVLTRLLAFSAYSSLFIVAERPARSSYTSSVPSENFLCHSNT